jgi:curved DNA-binding protein CbpA
MSATNHLKALGVRATATPEELKSAFRRRCRETHPDSGGSRIAFEAVTEAYEILCDAERREEWERDYLAVAESAGLVVCLVCYAINRVRPMRSDECAACAACRTPLEITQRHRRNATPRKCGNTWGSSFIRLAQKVDRLRKTW